MKKFIIFTLLLMLITSYIYTQTWSALGSGMNASYVEALAIYNGELIAAGYFTSAGGTPANNIAKWNGVSWSPLGSGVNSVILSLAIYNGDLIAAGDFTIAGGDSVKKIARWNGTQWLPLGSGTNFRVEKVIVYGNELIAGGAFTIAGGISVNRIARWNGGSWLSAGNNLLGLSVVTTFVVYEDSLYAAGVDDNYNGFIIKWNNSSWSSIVNFIDDPVYALGVYENELVAGGLFRLIGGVNVQRIAKWNGSLWSPLGLGVYDQPAALVNDLIVYGSELIVGGQFRNAGGNSANYIAKWNGTSWSTMGSGMSYVVEVFKVYNGDLIVGGRFLTAGGITVNRIAKWCCPVGINPISNEIPNSFSLSQNYPNPFNPQTKIKFDIPANVKGQTPNVKIVIYDLLGREVTTLVNEVLNPGSYEIDWDGSNYSSGVYFYKIIFHQGGSSTGDFVQTKKMVLMK